MQKSTCVRKTERYHTEETLLRYITIHDDRIPYPIKEYTILVKETGSYTETLEEVCEYLYHIDDMLQDLAKSKGPTVRR